MKQADDDEDFSTETEKMMKEVPGLKGAMLYARRRIIEKATARELARNAAISTTLPPFQFVNEKGEDTHIVKCGGANNYPAASKNVILNKRYLPK